MRWTLKPVEPATSTEPELPRVYVDTTLYAPTGDTHHVASGGNLQTAINAAALGDVITLEAGATFTGPFTLPDKGAGTDYIIIRTDTTDQNFVAEGTRVAPADASLMPHLVSTTSGVLIADHSAHHFRFIGLDISPQTSSFLYGLVWLGDGSETEEELQHHIIFDRCYVHGNATYACNRGLALNCGEAAVIDSHISGIKQLYEVSGDTQAIGGWAGSGPYKIVNNYLEAAGENFLLGGADPTIEGMIASDIEFRHNHVYKPLTWRVGDPSYEGYHWGVKNLFELKNVCRVLVEGNLFEQTWADMQSIAILFSPRNSNGSSPWSTVQDVTFRNNVVRSAPSGIAILGTDDENVSDRVTRVAIRNNLIVDIDSRTWGSDGMLFSLNRGINGLIIEHNTSWQWGRICSFITNDEQTTYFRFRNNITTFGQDGGSDGAYGVAGGSLPPYYGTSVLDEFCAQWIFDGNVLAAYPDNESIYPAGNYWPATYADIDFENLGSGDYRLAVTSDYKNAATDGTNIGIDKVALDAAMGSLAQTYW